MIHTLDSIDCIEQFSNDHRRNKLQLKLVKSYIKSSESL